MFWRKKPPEAELEVETTSDEARLAHRLHQRVSVAIQYMQHEPDAEDGLPIVTARAVLESNLDDLATIEDDFYRWFAAHQTVRLAVALGEFTTAKALLCVIQDPDIRAKAMAEHQNLRPLREASQTPPR